MTKYAVLCPHSADLATPFGLDWAIKLFGSEAIASLPVRTVGKNKGSPKGFVHWRKATVPGYCREVGHALAAGQLADAWIGQGIFSTRDQAMCGFWLGRVQLLAAGAAAQCFFAEGRARHAAEMQRYADRLAEEVAELAREREAAL